MSDAFDRLCDAIENSSDLDRLAARGTVRIGLRQAGLEADSVTSQQLLVVIEKILPGELTSRGVEWNGAMAACLAESQRGVVDRGPEAPDLIFKRLGSPLP